MFLAGKQILKIPHSNRIDVRFCACQNDVLGKSGKIGNVTLQQMVVMATAAFLPVTIPFIYRLTHWCPQVERKSSPSWMEASASQERR